MHRWGKEKDYFAVHEENLVFCINGKEYEFALIHNFHVLGLDIEKALHEWAKQAKTYTALSFCGYVMSEEYEHKIVCVPKEEWTEFQLNLNGLED